MDRIVLIVHRKRLERSVSGQNMMNQTLTPSLKLSYLTSQTKDLIPLRSLERNSGRRTLVSLVNVMVRPVRIPVRNSPVGRSPD